MRCDDCLDELPASPVFGVLKRNTLTAEEELSISEDPLIACLLRYRQTVVCATCAGWYDDAVELTED